MAKLQTLEKIRDKIRSEVMAKNLAEESNGDTKPLFNAMRIVPENRLLQLVQWVHEVILPKVLHSRGADSVEFQNYTELRDAVIWALYISDAYERQISKIAHLQLENGILRERVVLAEREAMKYTTVEQMVNAESVEMYRSAIVQRALSMLSKPTDNGK